MKKIYLVFMLGFIVSSFAKEFFYVDYSCFKTDDPAKTRAEIYISIPIYYLEFGSEMTSVFAIKVYVYDKEKLIAEDKWKQKYSISKEEDKYSGAEIPVVSKMLLPAGYYKLVVEVEDIVSGKQIDLLEVPQDSKMFMIAGFEDKFSMSTIQLASRIITDKPDDKSEFFKQGVIILPNPSKVYGTMRPFIYYYSEIYGLNKGDDIEYSWSISTPEGQEIKKGNIEKKKAPGLSMVLADRISVPSLKTGAYNLSLLITNNTSGKTIEGKNNFYIYRKIDFTKEKFRLPEDITNSQRDSIELDIMKDDDILTEYDQVYITLDKIEQDKYSGLILSGKREFLKKYWTEKELNQENSRKNFKALISQVNNEFSTKKAEGWKTDRGRIFLKLGNPSKRDVETYGTELADHEIWNYFSGNYTFIFADTHGLGDFKLIHSDYPGERSDPNWQTKIKKSQY